MRNILAAIVLGLFASHAYAGELSLDWSSPEALKASGAALSPADASMLTKAGLVFIIRSKTKETRFMTGVIAVGEVVPKDQIFPLMRKGLEGKSMDEIRAIALSMN